ncbi:MAG: cadherin-like domain-containing protein [Verrucomicrobiota bacterium]
MNRTETSRSKRWFFTRSSIRAYREWLEKRKLNGVNERRKLFAEALEPRVLFSAAPAAAPSEEVPAEEAETVQETVVESAVKAGADRLEQEDLEALAEEALERWKESGISADQLSALEAVEYRVEDLIGELLGQAEGSVITIDIDAAGREWFVDVTPELDEEFLDQDGSRLLATEDSALGGVDLLTTLLHEQGHILGLEDQGLNQSSDLMFGFLGEGIRRLPVGDQASGGTPGSLEGVRNLAATGTAGDFTVFTSTDSVGSGQTIANAGDSITHTFQTQVNASANDSQELTATSDGIALTAGHHLVLYNARFDATGFSGTEDRNQANSNLSLAGTDLAVGWSDGFARTQSGDNELVTAGGAIIDVATNGDVLQLHTQRTDNDEAGTVLNRTSATGIQVLKLDDSFDFFMAESGATLDGTTVATATFEAVTYTATETDAAFSFDAATGEITLNDSGDYLVFANTHFAGATGRTTYLQRLALDGTEVDGTLTSTYLRGSQSTDEGATAIGTLLTATAGQNLTVQVAQEGGSGTDLNITSTRSGITIVKLPGSAQTIALTDASNQNLNQGNTNSRTAPNSVPVTFDTSVQTDPSFAHTANQAEVTVQHDGDYLFLHQHEVFDPSAIRVVPNTGLEVNGGEILDYGQSARYNRDDAPEAQTSGNWGGALLDLESGDVVNMVSGLLGAGGNTSNSSGAALQGISLSSLFDPIFPAANTGITADAGTTTVITQANLETGAQVAASNVTYTLTSSPDAAIGSVQVGGAAVTSFTQDQVNNGLVSFVGAGGEGATSFDYTVNDGGGNSLTGTFALRVVAADSIDVLSGAGNLTTTASANGLLANEVLDVANTPVFVSSAGAATSGTAIAPGGSALIPTAGGANVRVFSDGSFQYDPAAFIGETDSFVYQLTDAGTGFVSSDVTVTLTVGDFEIDPLAETTDEDTVLTVDPLTDQGLIQQGSIFLNTDSNVFGQQRIGFSVDVDGDWAIVGMDAATDTERVIIYQRNTTTGAWEFHSLLENPEGVNTGDNYGFAIAIDATAGEEMIAVGAFTEDDGPGNDGGAVYIYELQAGVWNLTDTINGDDALPGIDGSDNFGVSVGLTNDGAGTRRLIVGAHTEDTGGSNRGAAYVFDYVTSVFDTANVTQLKASDAANNDQFGRSVSIDGNIAVVGAELEDADGQNNGGSAYVYQFDGASWVERQILTTAALGSGVPVTADDRFGFDVEVDGNTVAVGARLEDTGAGSRGSVFVYTTADAGVTWAFEAQLQPT